MKFDIQEDKDKEMLSARTNGNYSIKVNHEHGFWKNKHLSREARIIRQLRFGAWLYFFLLIFEGALRKWVLPTLSTPLLVVRDPIGLWMVFAAWNSGFIKANIYQIGMILIGVFSTFATILLGHGNVAVAVFGARILIIHWPLMFVIGRVFTNKDVIKVGNVLLWISIPMVILIGAQFYSPQTAWVNRGIGGDEAGGGFAGALGFFRPPGTFSFTSGNASFFSLIAFFVFFFWTNVKLTNRVLLIVSSIALLASIPLSISRTLFFSTGIAILFALIGVSRKPQYFGRVFGAIFCMFIILAFLSQTHFFQTATAAFTDRFTNANEAEGGLQGVFLDRYLGGLIGAITNSSQIPFFGFGLGMGTNVGAMLLTGKIGFLIAEGEWGRLIGEMGLLFGLIAILIRVFFSFNISILAYKQLTTKGDTLPWMLLGFALLYIPQAQWAQPTSLGFSTLIGGLIIASLNDPNEIQ